MISVHSNDFSLVWRHHWPPIRSHFTVKVSRLAAEAAGWSCLRPSSRSSGPVTAVTSSNCLMQRADRSHWSVSGIDRLRCTRKEASWAGVGVSGGSDAGEAERKVIVTFWRSASELWVLTTSAGRVQGPWDYRTCQRWKSNCSCVSHPQNYDESRQKHKVPIINPTVLLNDICDNILSPSSLMELDGTSVVEL